MRDAEPTEEGPGTQPSTKEGQLQHKTEEAEVKEVAMASRGSGADQEETQEEEDQAQVKRERPEPVGSSLPAPMAAIKWDYPPIW